MADPAGCPACGSADLLEISGAGEVVRRYVCFSCGAAWEVGLSCPGRGSDGQGESASAGESEEV